MDFLDFGEWKEKQRTEKSLELECLGEESPILFCKPKNQSKVIAYGVDLLGLDDFCLVMMTKGQEDILRNSEQNGVLYITWMTISNDDGLSLLTLMVKDDLNDAFPVMFMLCSSATKNAEVLFFRIMRDKLGIFYARAIMTDDRKSLLDAWEKVMGFVPYHLLSDRYVDLDWRHNLTTIQNKDVQHEVYKLLHSHLRAADSARFDENLNSLMVHLKKITQTRMFASYFEKEYLHRARSWADCYDKKSVGVNEHFNLDVIYDELLAVCKSKGDSFKVLGALLKIVKEKHRNRIIKIYKHAKELASHHAESMNFDLDTIQCYVADKTWEVKCEAPKFKFTITRKIYECKSKCPLICSSCHLCAHMFECSCKVHNFDKTMCKHIHAVGRLFLKKQNNEEGKSEESGLKRKAAFGPRRSNRPIQRKCFSDYVMQ